MDFVHLQVHSSYTLMKSAIHIEKLVKRASELGFEAIALTDEEVLHGSYQFIKVCQRYNVKPITGMTCHVYLPDEQRPTKFILLAKDEVGYQSLVQLSNAIHINEDQPTLSQLMELEGIIPIVSFYQNFMEELIYLNDFTRLHQLLHHINESFDQWYINVQPNQQGHVISWLQNEGKQYLDKAVVTDDVRYVNEKDRVGYEALRAMEHGATINQKSSKEDSATYLKRTIDFDPLFVKQWEGAINRTKFIAQQCEVPITSKWFTLPTYLNEKDQSSEQLLSELCYKAIHVKYSDDQQQKAKERLEHELSVINSMQFADYFLIVWDLVKFAKQSNILTGPGRGSAAGSIVAYLLNITEVDPIKHNLLFERFLNPERKTMPDIDIDFSDYRRDEVLHYVKNKYGENYVAQIITFGTFQAKSTIRELSKVFQLSREQLTYLLKQLPQQMSSLKEVILNNDYLKHYIKQSQQLIEMFQAAFVIEGLPRHHSVHAAGVIISNRPMLEKIPMFKGAEGVLLTQMPMNELESLGLLKMDFLGLRNLTLIERMIKQIEEREGKKISVEQIPKQDENTFRLLQSGYTTGVFQLESDGMKNALKSIKPTKFEDIVAVISLYRPGPMQFIETFSERKHGKTPVEYIHSDLKPVLNETYGVLIYQEQIMQIASRQAGFSLAQADLLRRAISKKDREAIEQLKAAFINGSLENGYDQHVAEQVFDWIERFADYGFNKSHAVAYSMISYQIAYFKANYPAYFYAELLTSMMHDSNKLERYLKEARQVGLRVLPPSVNESFGKFTVNDQQTIRFGLLAVKGFGKQALDEIVRARKQKTFKSLFDFCMRVSLQVVNRPIIESLIIVGAFDGIHPNRAQLLASIVQAMDQGELFSAMDDQLNWEDDLFNMEVEYTKVDAFPILKELSLEKEVMGFRISEHPISQIRRTLIRNGVLSINQMLKQPVKSNYNVVASISRMKDIRTKRGEQMAFVTLEDETNEIESVVFPKVYREVSRELEEEQMVNVHGRLDERQGSKQLIVEKIKPFNYETIPKDRHEQLYIKLHPEDEEEQLSYIKQVRNQFPGAVPIAVYSIKYKKVYQLSPNYDIDVTEDSLSQLKRFFHEEHVVLK
ncbi:DNA polymerase III subunit alpha [Alkalibacillus haloalkaliphilus]|uniref:DNA polymerase III subunit alpha n=1 Tax=Alkalibacillus haloalkaliphilus TaxID=94136 RepID=UPI002936414A|nr:DNA polymerase III subunit alpha [Alkalibacillus haloalkaliphilus]MDV2581209.1 DNA polymerase III subunit alpha [Alkalibacillus haloalkaliphilus]